MEAVFVFGVDRLQLLMCLKDAGQSCDLVTCAELEFFGSGEDPGPTHGFLHQSIGFAWKCRNLAGTPFCFLLQDEIEQLITVHGWLELVSGFADGGRPLLILSPSEKMLSFCAAGIKDAILSR